MYLLCFIFVDTAFLLCGAALFPVFSLFCYTFVKVNNIKFLLSMLQQTTSDQPRDKQILINNRCQFPQVIDTSSVAAATYLLLNIMHCAIAGDRGDRKLRSTQLQKIDPDVMLSRRHLLLTYECNGGQSIKLLVIRYLTGNLIVICFC